MPEIANPPSKTRVQLDLAPEEIKRMNYMMSVCGIETRKDLFNNAVTLLEWVVDEIMAGRKVASFAPDSQDRFFVTMPILRNAEENRDAYPPRRSAAAG